MLTIYRRHRKNCAHAADRISRKWRCSLWFKGSLFGNRRPKTTNDTKSSVTFDKERLGHNPSRCQKGIEAVWIACSDTAGSYEVEEEWIGMRGDGSLHLAYASSCSCWGGDYAIEAIKDIKVFKFTHEQMQVRAVWHELGF